MGIDNAHSGDHLEQRPGEKPAVVADVPARQAVTGHNVRYVLLFGTGGVIIGFVIAFLIAANVFH
jgi:hypothetical protein